MRSAAVALCASFVFALHTGCKFEPPLATAKPDGAAVMDGGPAKDAMIEDDGGINDDAETFDDATIGDAADAGDGGDAETNDAGLVAETLYRVTAGGGELSSARHRARIVVGAAATIQTATSTVHRVQFGGGAR